MLKQAVSEHMKENNQDNLADTRAVVLGKDKSMVEVNQQQTSNLASCLGTAVTQVTPKRVVKANIVNNGETVKSPSDTTIYTPALKCNLV